MWVQVDYVSNLAVQFRTLIGNNKATDHAAAAALANGPPKRPTHAFDFKSAT